MTKIAAHANRPEIPFPDASCRKEELNSGRTPDGTPVVTEGMEEEDWLAASKTDELVVDGAGDASTGKGEEDEGEDITGHGGGEGVRIQELATSQLPYGSSPSPPYN